MRRIFLKMPLALFLLLYALFGFFSLVSAQVIDSQPQAKKQTLSLYGWTPSQVEEKYGKPDNEQKKNDASFSWNYGSSTIFFLDGKVSAWSDHGEFLERSKLKELKKPLPKEQKADLSDEWINPWTPGNKMVQPSIEAPHE